MKKFSKFLISLGAFAPSLVLAENTFRDAAGGVADVLDAVLYWISTYIIPILIAVALLYFFWGIITYIRKAGDEKERGNARAMMMWGIIALFVMVSAWGLVSILQDTFGISDESVNPPSIPGYN